MFSESFEQVKNPKAVKALNTSAVIKIMHQNVQCVTNKLLDIEILLSEHSVEICCLTENWRHTLQLDIVKIDSYKIGSSFCKKEFKNGGVAILLRNYLNVEEISKVSLSSTEKISD